MIRISKDVVYREIDGAIVALSLTSGEYVGLDAIGTRIWQLLDETGSLPAVQARLLSEYDLDAATCQAEVDAFVSILRERGLISEASGAAAV